MSGASPDAGADELPLLVGGDDRHPERLLLLGRPVAGRVRTREWESTDWARPPAVREYDAASLLAELERAQRGGRRLNQELQAVRRWLQMTG